MKVAILSESAADEAVLRVLVDGILGQTTDPIESLSLRTRGWPSVEQVLRNVLSHLHYRTDADGLVLVVDSNHSPLPPRPDDPAPGKCRLTGLRRSVEQIQKQLRPVPNRPPVRTAVGLAIPAIEAWLLCGRDPNVSEAAWIEGLRSGKEPYSKHGLKMSVYGSDRPSRGTRRERGIEEASRLIRHLSLLADKFPYGFGALKRDLESWPDA